LPHSFQAARLTRADNLRHRPDGKNGRESNSDHDAQIYR
jgi:hypothetical protein